jgi:long-chain acyl-CoA synthetase
VTARTLSRLFLDRVSATPGARAGSSFVAGAWRHFTWSDYERRAREFGLGLVAAGLRSQDTVAILGATCPEWAWCDIGAIGVGAVTVGLYPTLSPEGVGSVHYVTTHSEARFLVVENEELLFSKIAPIIGKLPNIERIVVWDCTKAARALDPRVQSLDEIMESGSALGGQHPNAWRDAGDAVRPDHVAMLIYTSGTTGHPKGVTLSHENVWAQVSAVQDALRPAFGNVENTVAFLPMAHAAERCVAHWGRVRQGGSAHFARSIDTLLADLAEAHPTGFGSVPRIFEKAYARVRSTLAGLDPAMRETMDRVLLAGVAAGRARRKGEPVDAGTQTLADRFDQHFGARVRESFGGQCTWLISGAAPIGLEILEFFDACGLPIYEVYGLTETAGVLTMNKPGALRYGTVGKPIDGVELRIAEDGEVMARGPGVFRGYFKDDEATAACLHDGWFSTGDVGRIDADGFLTITDRKKDIVITAGGKNITPSNMENEVKRDPFVSHCHLHADRRPYPTALVSLDPERLRAFAAERGLAGTTAVELRDDPDVRARVQQAIDSANEKLARFEQIRKFAILPRELSVEGGELTPTLKVKRREVERIYTTLLDAMYRDS